MKNVSREFEPGLLREETGGAGNKSEKISRGLKGQTASALRFLLLLAVLCGSVIVASGLGAVHYSPREVLGALRHGPPSSTATDVAAVDIILWNLRLPRIVLAILVGACLGLAGTAFQSLTRNDLADPYLVGVSAGASVGAEAVLLKHGELWLHGLAVAAAAFISALATMSVVLGVARRQGRIVVTSLLLAGVTLSALLGSVSALLLQLGNALDSAHILGRLMGSLQDATFSQAGVIGAVLCAGGAVLMVQARSMNLFALGEESAQRLGVETEPFKRVLIVTGSLLTAATVAVAGVVGFVGLIVPHMARRLARTPDNRRIIPLAALIGAILLVWADTIARSVMPDNRELPVGIITAFLGAPFFCYLLARSNRNNA